MALVETHPAGSPEWWRELLSVELDKQRKRVELLEKYAGGDHPLPEPPKAMNAEVWAETKRSFLRLSKMGVTNWVKLVATAPSERLRVRGFRSPASTSTEPDRDVWRLWQENGLDAESQLLHDTVFVTGQAYSLVWPGPRPGTATITYEHPSQMIVAYVDGSRRQRRAALKKWKADDGRLMVTLYLPEFLYKWRTRSTSPGFGIANGELKWEERDVDGEAWPLPNPMREVPAVEFAVNTGLRARPYGGGVSEFDSVLPIQDRINKTYFDRLVTAESQAFKQRYTIGWEPPVDPKTNKPDPRAVFEASQSKLWTFPAGDRDGQQVQVGEFDQANFEPFIAAVENDVQAMAAISKTPPQYLLGGMVNIAGEALAAAETGLTTKTEAHATVLGEAHEATMRLAMKAARLPGADDQQLQTMWADIERRTWAEKIDGIIKLKGVGIPDEALMAMVPGATPQDVERWMDMRRDEELSDPEKDRQLSVAEMIQKIYLGVGKVITTDEARKILNDAGAALTGAGPAGEPAAAPPAPASADVP